MLNSPFAQTYTAKVRQPGGLALSGVALAFSFLSIGVLASWLLSSCASQDLASTYHDGWNVGGQIDNGNRWDDEPTDAAAYKYCDRALVDVYGTDDGGSSGRGSATERVYWQGCMNGTRGTWEQLPSTELASLARGDD